MPKLSRQKAIEAYCRECICDDLDTGTWRGQVTGCTAVDCPLYEYRPLDQEAKAIRKRERYDALSEEEKKAYDKRAKEAAQRMGVN